jgi:chemotaxis signal transduction protein
VTPEHESEGGGEAPVGSAGGLAEEMIPLLRKRLGLAPGDPPPRAATSILDFAHEVPRPDVAPAAPPVQLITFVLGGDRYALPIEQVCEILRVSPITRVPHAPNAVRGLMNVRGRLLTVVEIRTLVGMQPAVPDKESRIVMVEVRGRNLGLLVDSVGYVAKVPRDAMLPAPPEVVGSHAALLGGVASDEAGLVLVLDLERSFGSDGRSR